MEKNSFLNPILLNLKIEQYNNNSPISCQSGKGTIVCHFSSYNAIENETHFMLDCPLHNPSGDKLSINIWECSFQELQALEFF